VLLAEAAARIRPRFGLSHADERAPEVIALAQGPEEPIVACIPSLVATAGPHEFARFAKAFAGRRDVVAVPVPGFAAGELLPSMFDAAVAAQATAILRHADGRDFALVGFSTGGLLAYAVASECAREGRPPRAVVLIDSYTAETMARITEPVFERMLAADGLGPAITEDTLMAMGTYLGQLAGWTPGARVAPTLLVKAAEPLPGVVAAGDWQATWPARDRAVEVPGTHLTVLEDHAEATAAAVEAWLAHPQGGGPRRRRRRLHLAR
jgi:thioesterase domain-containing protein